jgi:antitoxin component YwqK of YwqJK toxin-antitoxin module
MPVTMDDGRQVIVFGDGQTVYVSPRGELTGPCVTAYRKVLEGNRRRDGVQVLRLTSGRRLEITWRNGVEVGPFRAYYETGELWAEATYVAGRPVGRHVVYDRAGKTVFETNFAVPARRELASVTP